MNRREFIQSIMAVCAAPERVLEKVVPHHESFSPEEVQRYITVLDMWFPDGHRRVATQDGQVMYDGPSPYWHGKSPWVTVKLDLPFDLKAGECVYVSVERQLKA